jgi:Ca2+-binding RTX toxin-like protein
MNDSRQFKISSISDDTDADASRSSLAINSNVRLTSRRIANGLDKPLFVTAPPGDTNRLFILEQKTGEIKILNLNTRTIAQTPFLKINSSDLLTTGFEQGLLGLAFHPDYANNGKFYVNYTAPGGGAQGKTKIVEYKVGADPNVADPSTARTILTYNQPEQNHNGGWMDFGSDGNLYIASGDGGGSGFKPGIPSFSDNSQDITDNLLGKILRLNVNSDAFPNNANRNYAIPADNPFVGKSGDDEIWVYGLRNPWRSSFDRANGNLYIGDVGQADREEINVQLNSSPGGENYGWNLREGTLNTGRGTPPANVVDPIYEYNHSVGQSIIGGYVYRGPFAAFRGNYIFGDFLSGKIWSLRYDGTNVSNVSDRTAELTPNAGAIDRIASFGQDGAGNLYIVDLEGEIFKIEPIDASSGSLSINNSSIVEGKPGTTNLSFTVSLSTPSSSTVTVNFATSNGTAIAGADYISKSGTLTFNAGQTRQTLTVSILDDNIIESAENFKVILSSPNNSTIADNTGVGTINDALVVSTTTTLPNTVENLRLSGTGAINGTGNNNGNIITGNSGNNTLAGKSGNDSLRGENGKDALFGEGGNDTLIGGAGKDVLIGGTGNDRLTGGIGSDRFRFNSFNEKSDRITDFSVVDDSIVLSATGFGGGLVANTTLSVAQFTINTTATTSAHRVIYNSSNGNLFFDRDGNASSFAPVQIATLNSGLGLTNADFLVR